MVSLELKEVAARLWELKAIETYPKGFWRKLKSGKYSPIFLNLRVPENKGTLDRAVVRAMAKLMHRMIMEQGLEFDYYCGLPRAGEPFADALAEFLDPRKYQQLTMVKVGEGSDRKITGFVDGQEIEEDKRILLVDDLVTGADTKLEAIAVAQAAGLEVAGILTFVDREQGGSEKLRMLGYPVYSVTTLRQLLKIYVDAEKLPINVADDIAAYLAASSS